MDYIVFFIVFLHHFRFVQKENSFCGNAIPLSAVKDFRRYLPSG